MNILNSQRGTTLIGWLFIISFIMLLGIGVMRLYPIYYDHFTVKTSLEKLAQDATIKDATVKQVQERLQRYFTLNNVETADPRKLEIVKKGGKMTLIMKYEARAAFLYNIEFVVTFDDSVVVQ